MLHQGDTLQADVTMMTGAERRREEFGTYHDFDSFGVDARKWAKAFCSRFKLAALDETIMLGWFKAAIDAGQIYSRDFSDDPDNLARFDKGDVT